MIPKTYQQWYRCITEECGIPLTQAFIASRLAVLESQDHQETRRFVSLYGQHHLNSVVQWFKSWGRIVVNLPPFAFIRRHPTNSGAFDSFFEPGLNRIGIMPPLLRPFCHFCIR